MNIINAISIKKYWWLCSYYNNFLKYELKLILIFKVIYTYKVLCCFLTVKITIVKAYVVKVFSLFKLLYLIFKMNNPTPKNRFA